MRPPLLFIGSSSTPEVMIILTFGLLLSGAKLPEVGRSLGRGLLEFKKGLRGMQDQVNDMDREADRRIDAELADRDKARAETPKS